MNALKIQISGLSEGIHRYDFTVSSAELTLGDNFEGNVAVASVLDKTATQMLLTASIEATGTFACDRCVSQFQLTLSPAYRMVYVSEGMDDDQLDPAEVQVIPAGSNVIDITEDVRQTLLLAVPLKLLCSDSCKGLCPHCGKNLNEVRCDCSGEQIDSRWEQLRKLQSN